MPIDNFKHVDDFINDINQDPYARLIFHLYRCNANITSLLMPTDGSSGGRSGGSSGGSRGRSSSSSRGRSGRQGLSISGEDGRKSEEFRERMHEVAEERPRDENGQRFGQMGGILEGQGGFGLELGQSVVEETQLLLRRKMFIEE